MAIFNRDGFYTDYGYVGEIGPYKLLFETDTLYDEFLKDLEERVEEGLRTKEQVIDYVGEMVSLVND